MTMFAAALAAFILLHVGLSATPLRAAAIRAIGEWPYRGLFSAASAIVLAWMIFSFGAARGAPENQIIWDPPSWGRHATALLVLLAFLLAVPGLIAPGPTMVGMERGMAAPEPARGMTRITRHPFLWGVALWGAGHLLANGETTSLMLFGGLLAMVLLGTRSIDRKAAARDPEGWARFKAVTSNVPFAAILQGRNRLVLGEVVVPLLVALAVFAATIWFHRVFFGVAPFDFGA